jgi:hypothetical protein
MAMGEVLPEGWHGPYDTGNGSTSAKRFDADLGAYREVVAPPGGSLLDQIAEVEANVLSQAEKPAQDAARLAALQETSDSVFAAIRDNQPVADADVKDLSLNNVDFADLAYQADRARLGLENTGAPQLETL